MKTIIASLALLFVASVASAQIKKWTDADGVVHYENEARPRDPTEELRKPGDQATPGKAQGRIDRTHAGLTLGDAESSYRASRQWFGLGADKFGGQVFIGSPPIELKAKAAMFVDGRLSMIRLTYRDYTLGGWDTAVLSTANKYGPPKTDGTSASWRDDRTGLSLKKDYRGGIEIMIADMDLMERYNARSGQARPKF